VEGRGATFNRVNIFTNQNKTLMKQIPNSQKSVGKSIRYQPTDFKNLKKKILEPKVSRLLPKHKKNPYVRVWI
jgi:hypothetical protein